MSKTNPSCALPNFCKNYNSYYLYAQMFYDLRVKKGVLYSLVMSTT